MKLNPEDIAPLNDRVLVRRADYETAGPETKSSILIPDMAKSASVTGVVVSVGAGRIFETGEVKPLTVKPGDWVLMGKYTGQDLELADNHVILREDEVMAVLRSAGA